MRPLKILTHKEIKRAYYMYHVEAARLDVIGPALNISKTRIAQLVNKLGWTRGEKYNAQRSALRHATLHKKHKAIIEDRLKNADLYAAFNDKLARQAAQKKSAADAETIRNSRWPF